MWLSDLKEQLHDTACEVAFEPCYNEYWSDEIERKVNNMRDYYGETFWCYYEAKYKDKECNTWTAEIVPIIRGGYYANANLDFYIQLHSPYGDDIENEDVMSKETVEDLIADYVRHENVDEELFNVTDVAELFDNVNLIIKQAVDKFYEFAESSGLDEYICRGEFGNGEAFYLNKTELAKHALKK